MQTNKLGDRTAIEMWQVAACAPTSGTQLSFVRTVLETHLNFQTPMVRLEIEAMISLIGPL